MSLKAPAHVPTDFAQTGVLQVRDVAPWSDMLSHHSYLVSFARRRLRDPMLAEDVVHDVFEAVLSGRAAFAGRSTLRTWLVAILKNKIVDLVRERSRFERLDDESHDDDAHALECPNARPDELAEQREWLARTLKRIEALPIGLRSAMQLRVLQDQPAETVCRMLAITEVNLHVRLHRARRQLLS